MAIHYTKAICIQTAGRPAMQIYFPWTPCQGWELGLALTLRTPYAGRAPGLEWVPAGRSIAGQPVGPPSSPKLDGASIIAACEAELRRLQTDHIDLFQLHWPDR